MKKVLLILLLFFNLNGEKKSFDDKKVTVQDLFSAVNEFDFYRVRGLVKQCEPEDFIRILKTNLADQDKNTLIHLAITNAMYAQDNMERDVRLKVVMQLVDRLIDLEKGAVEILNTENRYKQNVLHLMINLVMSASDEVSRNIRIHVFKTVLSKIIMLDYMMASIFSFRPVLVFRKDEQDFKFLMDSPNHFAFKFVQNCYNFATKKFGFSVLRELIDKIEIKDLEKKSIDVFIDLDQKNFTILHSAIELAYKLKDENLQSEYYNVFKLLLNKIGLLSKDDIKKIFLAETSDNLTVFHLAFKLGLNFNFIKVMFETVKKLEKESLFEIFNKSTPFGCSPIYFVISNVFKENSIENLRAILDSRIFDFIDFTVQNQDEQTPLKFAVKQVILGLKESENSEGIIKFLIKKIRERLEWFDVYQKKHANDKKRAEWSKEKKRKLLDDFNDCRDKIALWAKVKKSRIINDGKTQKVKSFEGDMERLDTIFKNVIKDTQIYVS